MVERTRDVDTDKTENTTKIEKIGKYKVETIIDQKDRRYEIILTDKSGKERYFDVVISPRFIETGLKRQHVRELTSKEELDKFRGEIVVPGTNVEATKFATPDRGASFFTPTSNNTEIDAKRLAIEFAESTKEKSRLRQFLDMFKSKGGNKTKDESKIQKVRASRSDLKPKDYV